ncbi:MAG: hypothetical protein KF724_03710 [Phycisphaeraceae bacterium]|nr:hypothetical protein [Phycisphaeraceae bacterium]
MTVGVRRVSGCAWWALIASLVVMASTRAAAQVFPTGLNGRSQPVGIVEVADLLRSAGVPIEPETLWRCYGEYLTSVEANIKHCQASTDALGVDGTRYEAPDSVRRAITVVRGAMSQQHQAIERLVECACRAAPDDSRSRLGGVLTELRVRWLARFARGQSMSGIAQPFDLSELLEALPPATRQSEAVRQGLAASAPRRERVYRALLDAILAQRLRLAEACAEFGISGLTFQEGADGLREHADRAMKAYIEARAAAEDAPPQPFVDPLGEFWALRETPELPLRDLLVAQREAVEAVASQLEPEQAKRLRRVYRNQIFNLDGFMSFDPWDLAAPSRPSPQWFARRVLSQRSVTGERRAEAIRIFNEWLDAEDALKEQAVSAALSDPDWGRTSTSRHFSMFRQEDEVPPELEALSTPFRKRLASLLGMAWIADSAVPPDPLPEVTEFPEFTTAEQELLGGSPRTSARTPPADSTGRRMDWFGRFTLGTREIDAWMRLLGESLLPRATLEALVEAHGREWEERVAPHARVAMERRPGESGRIVTYVVVGENDQEPEGTDEWRRRVSEAIDLIEAAADEIDRRLFESIRAALPPEESWRADAISFSRRADSVISIPYAWVSWLIVMGDLTVFGGARVSPLDAIRSARFGTARELEAVRMVAPRLQEFQPLIDEERLLLRSFVRMANALPRHSSGEQSPLARLETQAPLRSLQERWRHLERQVLAELDEMLTPSEKARLERAVVQRRFAQLFWLSNHASRACDELRDAAARSAELERGLSDIERIDAAEEALAAGVVDTVGGVVTLWSEPLPKSVDSVQGVRDLSQVRQRAMEGPREMLRSHGQRCAWYMVQTLPESVIAASPSFMTFAAGTGVPVNEEGSGRR